MYSGNSFAVGTQLPKAPFEISVFKSAVRTLGILVLEKAG